MRNPVTEARETFVKAIKRKLQLELNLKWKLMEIQH